MLKIRSQTIVLLFLAVAVALVGALMRPSGSEEARAVYTWYIDANGGTCTSIGSGSTWDSATKTCILGSSVSQSFGTNDAIEILADNVTLDCNGFAITSSPTATGSASGVRLNNRSNVVVKNCLIQNFVFGIYNLGSSGSNNVFLNNTPTGNNNGIVLAGNNSFTIGNNPNSNYIGIGITGWYNNIYANKVYNNTAQGINNCSGAYNNIIGNVAYGNSQGIDCHCGSAYNLYKANRSYSNSTYGFIVNTTGASNVFQQNITTGNTTLDIYYSGSNGTFTNNTCGTSSSGQCTWPTPIDLSTGLITSCGQSAPARNLLLGASLNCTSLVNGVNFPAASNITLACDSYNIASNYSSTYYAVNGYSTNFPGQTVVGCSISGIGSGIRFYYDASAFGNTLTNTGTYGIYHYYPTTTSVLAGNTITGASYGIRAYTPSYSGGQILGNVISNNASYGLYVGQPSQIVRYNKITNSYYGMRIGGTSGVDFVGDYSYNFFDGSSTRPYGIYLYAEGNTINRNVVKNFTSYGLYAPSNLYNDNSLNDNVVINNTLDFYDAGFNSGDNNTCNKVHFQTYPWEDTGEAIGCTYSTITSACGNGVVEVHEKCDDGGNVNPGCSASCLTEGGYTCATAGVACTPTSTTYCHLASCDGLVGTWPMDNAVADDVIIYDNSGQINRGMLNTNGGMSNISGKVNSSMVFDGNLDYVEINDDPSLKFGSGDFTISAWVKVPVGISGSYPAIVDKEDAAGTRQGYGLSLNHGNGYRPRFDVFSGGIQAGVESTYTINDDQWHLLTATKASSQICITVDNYDPACTPHGLGEGSTDKTIPLRIGAKATASPNYFFTGGIDDVLVWNRALPNAEAWRLYNSPRTDLPTAMTFTAANGSTDILAQQNIASISNLKLAKSANEFIQWSGTQDATSKNYDAYVKVNTNYVTVDKAAIPALNAAATVSVNIGTCTNWNIYHATSVVTSLSQLRAAGPRVGYGSGASGTCTSYCSNPTCSGGILTYTVPGFDSTGGESGVCGNGLLEGLEACDDNNINNSDGCSSSCAIESGYGCAGEPSVCSLGAGPTPVVTVGNSAPSFVPVTGIPSDNGSIATNPTNVGSDVTFSATATDANSDSYYLLICNNGSAPTASNPPECNGGSGNRFARSATAVASGDPATAIHTAAVGDSSSNAWYAFVCDTNASPSCSVPDQGSGDNGSPFYVNHAPSLGTVKIGAVCDSTTSIDPGNSRSAKVTTDIGGGSDTAYAAVIQSDGKIVVAGDNGSGDFALTRYHADGTLDTTFSGDGKQITDIGGNVDVVNALSIQTDGKIVAIGNAYNGANNDFAVARYNTDGSLDTTFSGDGKDAIDISGGANDYSQSVALQSDGKIVIAGGSGGDFVLVRYNTNGTLDTTFSGDGKVIQSIGSYLDSAYGVAIQSDGKIVAAGSSGNGSNNDFALARFNTNGTLDTDFDTDGIVITPIGSSDEQALSIAIQPSNGKIVVAGYAIVSGQNFAVARYNTNGSLDTSGFNSPSGYVTTPMGSSGDFASSVAIDSSGNILAAGYTYNANNDFALVRYTTSGSLDTTFSGDGKVTTDFNSSDDWGASVALQTDGKIVLAGAVTMSTLDFGLVRYTTAGALDNLSGYACVQAGITDTDTSNTVDVHVCSTNSFTGSACSDTTLCSITDFIAGSNAQCLVNGQVPIPTAHGAKNVYIFTVDNFGFQGTGTSSQSYTVTDLPPSLISYATSEVPVLAAGGSDNVVFTATVSDNNGDSDVTAMDGVFFDNDAIPSLLSNGTCTPIGKQCYLIPTCALDTASGTDTNRMGTCTATVYYNANPSNNWELHVNPTTDLGRLASLANSNLNIGIPQLGGIGVVEPSIAYGSLYVDTVSSAISTSVANMGNVVVDVTLQGTDMSYSTYTISRAQQKWAKTAGSGFNWETEGHTLLATSGAGSADANGCADLNLAVRDNSTDPTNNQTLYWKIKLPAQQATGSYTGQNTFALISPTSCSGTP